MANLRQISKKTGFSVSTVSRVLRGHSDVDTDTRGKVLQGLRQAGYSLEPLIRRRGRPPKLPAVAQLAVVCTDQGEVRRSPFFAPLLSATLEAPARFGARIQAVDWPAGWPVAPEALASVNGVIALNAGEAPVREMARRWPVVTLDTYLAGSGADGIVVDYRRAAFEAARIFLEKGHRRIALLSAKTGPSEEFWDQLFDGARRAMALADVDPSSLMVAGYATTPEEGLALARELLRRPAAERPTALFGSDHAMLGALRAAHDLGLQVPKDVAVLGIDGIGLGEYSVPRLSTFRVDREAMARLAVERILQRLAHRDSPACRILIDCPFVARDSC